MKKRTRDYRTLGYLLAVIGLFAWLGFLFFDAKSPRWNVLSHDPSTNQSEKQEDWSEISEANWEIDALLNMQEEHLSLDQIDLLATIKEKITLLEQSLAQMPSFDLKKSLLDAYLLDHQYDKSRHLYASFSHLEKSQLDPKLPFRILFNSFSQTNEQEYQALLQLFQKGKENWLFSAEENLYYQVVFLLVEKKYQEAQALLPQLKTTSYAGFADALLAIFQQMKTLKDLPPYYQQGLIAFQLMKNEAFGLAKKLALPLINEYPNYILPQQILANVDFKLGNKDSALSYFQKLLEIDPSQKNSYLYHLGILNFQLENYREAVLYFSQITDDGLMLDGDRYLVLSYLKLGDEAKAIVSWQRLLGQPEIKKSDFYSFFQEALRNPYLEGRDASYLSKDPGLVKSYLAQCDKKLQKADQVICAYWKIGLQVHTAAQKSPLLLDAKSLLKDYQNAGLYLLIWDALRESQKYEEALESYLKALKLSHHPSARNKLKKLILETKQLINTEV